MRAASLRLPFALVVRLVGEAVKGRSRVEAALRSFDDALSRARQEGVLASAGQTIGTPSTTSPARVRRQSAVATASRHTIPPLPLSKARNETKCTPTVPTIHVAGLETARPARQSNSNGEGVHCSRARDENTHYPVCVHGRHRGDPSSAIWKGWMDIMRRWCRSLRPARRRPASRAPPPPPTVCGFKLRSKGRGQAHGSTVLRCKRGGVGLGVCLIVG